MTTDPNARIDEPTPAGVSESPVAAARTEFHAPRRRWVAHVLIATLSLAAGAGATLLAIRWQADPPRTDAMPATGEPATHAEPARPAPPAPDAVYVSAARQQLIGVRTAEVTHQTLEPTVKTVGVLAYDETRVAEIHTKVAGWVERVYVDFVGKPVRRGQALVSIYSPDLVATQKEYLLALKAHDRLASSQFEETRTGVANLLNAARERLKFWDVTDAQIAALEQSGEVRRTLTIYSPFSGVILERNTFAGQYLSPEMAAVKIADLSTVWALGEIFEYELPRVGIGQTATVEFPYAGGTRTLTGRITFIYPDIDPQTRRARMRVEFRNPGLDLKPGAYVTMTVKGPGASELVVPAEAVIDDGDRQYALLALGDGYFQPREIEVGAPVGDLYPVLQGLAHGDRVVTSAQFLIDSESNLKAAMQSMAGHGHGGGGDADMAPASEPGAAPVDHGAHQPAPAARPAKPPVDHSKHQP